jgi:hypothetical protein
MAAPTPLTGHRVEFPPDMCIHFLLLPSTEAKRSGWAKRSEEEGFAGLPRLRQSTSHARQRRPSRAQRPGRSQRRKAVRGFNSTTTQHSTPTRRGKPCAAARPSAAEKGGSGVFPDNKNPTRTHAEEGQPRSAERGVRGSSQTLAAHLARSPKKAKLRAANRPSAAKKGGSGESPGYDTTQHAQVLEKAKRSGQAEISGEYPGGLPRLWGSNLHARRRSPS